MDTNIHKRLTHDRYTLEKCLIVYISQDSVHVDDSTHYSVQVAFD